MTKRVLVIGSTGAVGSLVATRLVQEGQAVRSATRDPAAAQTGTPPGELVAFDFERPETFAPALSDVDRVFLIARPGDEHPERVAAPLIDEMKRQGVARVVNLTALGVEQREDFGLRKVERMLEQSGIAFTHLRPNWFMQVFSAGPLLHDIRTTGAIHIPAADARISYVDVRDIAAMAVVALNEPSHAGKAYTLTGGEALTHDRIAATLSEVTGKTIHYVPVTDDEARTAMAAGLGPERVQRLLGFYQLVRAGFCAAVSPDIEHVLGRPPITFHRFAADYVIAWL